MLSKMTTGSIYSFSEIFNLLLALSPNTSPTNLQAFFKLDKSGVLEFLIGVGTEIIKTSALDCIPHTRDDKTLNEKCIRFSNSLENEISYFPG